MAKINELSSVRRATAPSARARTSATQFYPQQYMNLPTNPLQWHPEQQLGVDFAAKLLGPADTIAGIMSTEAGKQYKEAAARAARGDFTIDKSGLLTFSGAQQRALSEVEGANAGEAYVRDVQGKSLEFMQELSKNDALTSAQKIEAYEKFLDDDRNAYLSAGGKDKEWVMSAAERAIGATNGLKMSYRKSLVSADINKQLNGVSEYVNNGLNAMPSGLGGIEKIQYYKDTLADGYTKMTQVSGGDPEVGVSLYKAVIEEAVYAGDIELIEGMKDVVVNGASLGARGVVGQKVIEQAEGVAKRNEDDDYRRTVRRRDDNYNSFGVKLGVIQNKVNELRGIQDPAEKDRLTVDILDDINEQQTLVNEMSAEELGIEHRDRLNGLFEIARSRATSGANLPVMGNATAQEIRDLVRGGDKEAAVRRLQELLPNYDVPEDLHALRDAAMTYNLQDMDTALRRNSALDLFVTSVHIIPDQIDPAIGGNPNTPYARLNSADGRAKKERAIALYGMVKGEHPEWTERQILTETESRFYKEFTPLNAEEVGNRENLIRMEEASKRFSSVALDGNSNIRDLITTEIPESDWRRIEHNLRGRGFDDVAIANINAARKGGVDADMLIVTEKDEVRFAGGVAKYNIGWTKAARDASQLSVHCIDKDGNLVVRSIGEISPEDQKLTPAFDNDGVIRLQNGQVKTIKDLTLEEIESLSAKRQPIHNAYAENYNNLAMPRAELKEAGFVGNAWMNLNYTNRDIPLDEHYVVLATGEFKKVKDTTQEERATSTLPFNKDMKIELTNGESVSIEEYFLAYGSTLASGMITGHLMDQREIKAKLTKASAPGKPIVIEDGFWFDSVYDNLQTLTPIDQMNAKELMESAERSKKKK